MKGTLHKTEQGWIDGECNATNITILQRNI